MFIENYYAILEGTPWELAQTLTFLFLMATPSLWCIVGKGRKNIFRADLRSILETIRKWRPVEVEDAEWKATQWPINRFASYLILFFWKLILKWQETGIILLLDRDAYFSNKWRIRVFGTTKIPQILSLKQSLWVIGNMISSQSLKSRHLIKNLMVWKTSARFMLGPLKNHQVPGLRIKRKEQRF